jgi:predicted ATP-grasp superfamily ATP-dependent carboligase
MVGVLHDACARSGLKSASLWAAVPHYVSLTPSPRAAKALVDKLAALLGADVDSSELDEAAESYAQQVSEAVASDEETAAYVQELERRVDELAQDWDVPTGDSIAAELTRFLRERERDQGDDDVARG